MGQESLRDRQRCKGVDSQGIGKTLEIHIQCALTFRSDDARVVDQKVQRGVEVAGDRVNGGMVSHIENQRMKIFAEQFRCLVSGLLRADGAVNGPATVQCGAGKFKTDPAIGCGDEAGWHGEFLKLECLGKDAV